MGFSRSPRRLVAATTTVVVLAALGTLAGGASASAYNTFGCRWSSTNVSVMSYAPTGYTTADANARSDWSNNTDVNFFTGSAYDVTINYSNQGATGWNGVASGSSTCSGGIYSTTIPITINRYYTDAFTSSRRQSTITHELGHAIGLAHIGSASTPCASVTIMNPDGAHRSGTCGVNSTRTDDRNGANALY